MISTRDLRYRRNAEINKEPAMKHRNPVFEVYHGRNFFANEADSTDTEERKIR